VTNVVVVPEGSQLKTLQDLIRLAKEKPGQVTFCSSGSGSLHHLAGEVMKRVTGTDMIHVPFKGAGPAMAALAGSEVTFGFTSMPSAMPLIIGKRIRPLAVTSQKRMPALPATPTMTEAGVPPPPGLDIREWYGVIVPADRQQAERRNGESVQAPGCTDAAHRHGGGVRGQLSAGAQQAARERREDMGEVGKRRRNTRGLTQ
jgi:tripartite-type tricarboxylate transporter receptor subunit TctC